MLKKILIGFAVLLAIFLIVVAFQPADFRLSRSTTIAATPDSPFALVNDFHKWEFWSPWDKMDPNLKRTYEGPSSGKGTIYSWVGNDKVGKGRMTIEESVPNEKIVIKLEFIEPFAATNTAEFNFKPDGKQTGVTWSMYGKNNFFAKAMCMFMNMDKMVGPDFEKGLAQMKTVAEAAPAAPAPVTPAATAAPQK